jgi:lipopolysaccharide transport system ATP-binding protein
MNELFNYCHHTIRLEKGEINSEGNTGSEISNYLEDVFKRLEERKKENLDPEKINLQPNIQCWQNPEDAPGNENVRFERFSINTDRVDNEAIFFTNEEIFLKLDFNVLKKNGGDGLVIAIYTMNGNPVFYSSPEFEVKTNIGKYRLSCVIPRNLLNQGIFIITIFQAGAETYYKFTFEANLIIKLAEGYKHKWFQLFPGPVKPQLIWNYELIK